MNKVSRRIFNHLPVSVRVKLFELFLMDSPCGYGEVFRVTLNKALSDFLTSEERSDGESVKRLTDDIVKCWIKYKALPYEYFSFDLRNSDDKKRSSFLTDTQKNIVCLKYSGLEAFQKEINDKYAFYQLMQPFFCRRVIQVSNATDREEFVRFAMERRYLFCKLSKGSRGKGAFPAEIATIEDADGLFSQLTSSADSVWVVEERIRQRKEMAQWNASCVNTVRLPAILTKDGFKVLDPFFRTGRAGAVVDNAGQGGVFAAIDPATGVLISDGVDEYCHTFPVHPDSGLRFKGWRIPCWDDLLAIAEKAHRTIPHHKYLGWDFALTDSGWVLIEGNWGQFVGQYATKVGVRDLFMKYMTDFI